MSSASKVLYCKVHLSHAKLKISELSGVFLCLPVNIQGIPSHNTFRSKISHTHYSPPPSSTPDIHYLALITPTLEMISSPPPRSFVFTLCSLTHAMRITFTHPNQGYKNGTSLHKALYDSFGVKKTLLGYHLELFKAKWFRTTFQKMSGLNRVYLQLSTVPFSHIRLLTLSGPYFVCLGKFCYLNSFLPLFHPAKLCSFS